jgi:hypothetical protein
MAQTAVVILPAAGAKIALLDILHEALSLHGTTTSIIGFD